MYIEQMYTNCLAEAAYYVESNGEAVIIDPIRETEQYVEKAASRGAKITYILETHFHADFVSGHLDLAKATGAPIVYGPNAEPAYAIHSAKDGEILKVGDITIEVLHTPGHTPESTCYLLRDEHGNAHAIFTGDTLFVGDVGRPDLLDGKMTKEALASMMYESLTTKIKPLADDVIVYPAHGPGSACGKNIGKETWSTIGHQKKSNYALQDMTREEFISALTDGLKAPPQYYFKDAAINKQGYSSLESVLTSNVRPLALRDLDDAIANGALILDTRIPDAFEAGFIPGSINVGLNGTYAWWVGTLVPIEQELVIVADAGKEEEAILRLARIGYENVRGYLEGGIATWKNAGRELSTITSINPEEFDAWVDRGYNVIDVRNPGEFQSGHIDVAENAVLGDLNPWLASHAGSEQPLLIHCAGGYRSMIAASMMLRAGIPNVVNVRGGFGKIKEHSNHVSDQVEA